MTAWLISLFPGWLTGSAGSQARRVVNRWTQNNETLRTLRYGWIRRFLLWNADHPVIFAILIGAFTAGVAYIVDGHHWADKVPNLPKLTLGEEFELSSYTAVPWGVQATLVALVYPIVLSFIALMLQRRAQSTVALRVYVLDSAIVPAGASSIGLLLAMGVQYFAAPYIKQSFITEHMASLPVMNGTWFVINVFLTGFFLSRTVRFVQEEEQRHSYTRVAVDIVLRAELTSAMQQYIFVNAPHSYWGFERSHLDSEAHPQVQMFGFSDGEPTVQRDLKGNFVLQDVHLSLLKLVVNSWCKRASSHQKNGREQTPIIFFPPIVGTATSGQVVLCSVKNGPSLTHIERFFIRMAFFYRPYRHGKLSLSTKKMLEEMAAEVQASAELKRFGTAEDGLRNLLLLYKTLLLASAADSQDITGNAATLGTSPYAWGERSFNSEWLETYREINRLAVTHLEQDTRLFKRMAVIPASITYALPPKPEKLIIDAMWVGTNLMYQLGIWWTQKADASLVSGESFFSGTLPAPLSKVYEQAIVDFVGSWGHLHIQKPKSKNANPADEWDRLTARALVYAKHIENSAEMFLDAVSRGDEVASRWMLDSFLKWWGNREYELRYGNLDKYQVRHVTLTLAEKTWPEVQSFLCDGGEHITIETAGNALSLSIRRYWENIRLYLVLLLIHNAGPKPEADCREFRFAASLIEGAPLYDGGKTSCKRIADVDSITTALLGMMFGIETVEPRIDAFAEKLHRTKESPIVSGWIYSWSGTPPELSQMKLAQLTLLVAVAAKSNRRIGKNKRLIESWWRDLDNLKSVARHYQELQQLVLSDDFNSLIARNLASAMHSVTEEQILSARNDIASTMEELSKVALHEHTITLRALTVCEHKIKFLGMALGTHAFDPQHWPKYPRTTLKFVPGLEVEEQSVWFEDDKSNYAPDASEEAVTGVAESMAEHVRQLALAWSLHKCLTDTGEKPLNEQSLRENYDATATEKQAFISAVAERCSSLRSAGIEPVILVGHSLPTTYLEHYSWGPNTWQCELPSGIALRHGEPSKNEPPVTFINDTPVLQFDTPNGDCYVVPSTMLNTLELAGSDPSSALSISWTQLSDEKLKFLITWKARFRLQLDTSLLSTTK